MNLFRTLLIVALVAVLAACAGKPARTPAPVSTVVAAEPAPSSEIAATADMPAVVPAAAPAPAAAADVDTPPTGAEEDFAALYGGSAPTSANTSGEEDSLASYDPWEPLNRSIHRFNNAIDRAVARPLATAYSHVVPGVARTGVSNFFSNLRAPVTITNQLLQGRPGDAWDSLGRFLMNSTLGLGGLFDPASQAMVPRRKEDFGQTLGVWGWTRSRYVELPFFGPRTIRDVFGLAGDVPLSPIRTIELDRLRIGLQGLQLVDTRAQLLAVDDIRDSAVDEYALTRDAWLQRRSYQIERDRRGAKNRDQDDMNTIPVDAMPMPNWGD
ncbi:MAG: VacJ family lipoprotein [Stenotrophomonas sp.]